MNEIGARGFKAAPEARKARVYRRSTDTRLTPLADRIVDSYWCLIPAFFGACALLCASAWSLV